jgi:hypothetical protein
MAGKSICFSAVQVKLQPHVRRGEVDGRRRPREACEASRPDGSGPGRGCCFCSRRAKAGPHVRPGGLEPSAPHRRVRRMEKDARGA